MTKYGPKVSLKGERPESKRVEVTDYKERDLLAKAIDFHLVGVRKWDRYSKMLSNARKALRDGRSWLTVRQYGYAKACLENYNNAIKKMTNYKA